MFSSKRGMWVLGFQPFSFILLTIIGFILLNFLYPGNQTILALGLLFGIFDAFIAYAVYGISGVGIFLLFLIMLILVKASAVIA